MITFESDEERKVILNAIENENRRMANAANHSDDMNVRRRASILASFLGRLRRDGGGDAPYSPLITGEWRPVQPISQLVDGKHYWIYSSATPDGSPSIFELGVWDSQDQQFATFPYRQGTINDFYAVEYIDFVCDAIVPDRVPEEPSIGGA